MPRAIGVLCCALLWAILFPSSVGAQQAELSPEEQQDLVRAYSQGTSAMDLIRDLEAHLRKYPNSPERAGVERTLAKAAIELNDFLRIAKYGESAAAATPGDFVLLDRLAYALLMLGGPENAGKAYRYARAYEDLVAALPVATGRDATRRQDEQERALCHALLYQSRARTIQKDDDDALRLATRAFDAYPGEETAREWAEVLLRMGKTAEALDRLSEAFVIPDPFATDAMRQGDRLLLGEQYAKLHGSEKGLGDLILAAYDRTSTVVQTRRQKLLALDPNSAVANPMEFTVTGLDGKKLRLASLKGKLLILDFWATWCGPCRVQHPLYETLRQQFGSRPDVVFLKMNSDEDHSVVEPFLTAEMWDKDVYFEDGLGRLFNVTNIPSTILIDKSGRVASRMDGFDPSTFLEQMTDRIQTLLADSPPTVP